MFEDRISLALARRPMTGKLAAGLQSHNSHLLCYSIFEHSQPTVYTLLAVRLQLHALFTRGNGGVDKVWRPAAAR